MVGSADDVRVLISRKRGSPHEGWQWEPLVVDAEQALVKRGFEALAPGPFPRLQDFAGRVASRAHVRPIRRAQSPDTVVFMMGPKPRLLFPHGYSSSIDLFVWDVWPVDEQRWRSIFDRFKPARVYFTAREAYEFWKPRLPTARCEWLGEAIEPRPYSDGASDLAERPIDILEMGRPYDKFRRAATEASSRRSLVHLHPTATEPFIFPDQDSLIRGLNSSKLLACFPASTTDPSGRSGGWETMTYRYLEAVASKTLIVGKIPMEMCDLFGFVPGVNLTPSSDWSRQLEDVVAHIDRFQELVNKAHETLYAVATWDVRADQISSHMAEEHY